MYCEFFGLSFTFKNGLYYLRVSLKGVLVWQVHEALLQHHLPANTADLNSSLCCWGTMERCPDSPIMNKPLLSLQFVTPSASTALTPMTLGTILLRIPCWARGGDNQNQTYTEAPICHLLISTWPSCPHHFDKLLSLWISAKWPSGLTYPTWISHTTQSHSQIQTPFLLN